MSRLVRSIRRRLLPFSDYEHTIPPEIVNDELFDIIRALAATASISTVLEIGSSTGAGSTRAFVDGIHENPNHPLLFCMEASRPRFEELAQRYGRDPQVKCYNLASVPLNRFPTESEVIEFYRGRETMLNRVPLREVLRWLRQDIRYVSGMGATQSGIQAIKVENGIDRFGMVLIDGSEFTGPAELQEIYGADYILLDDVGTFKNLLNFERLNADQAYRLRDCNRNLRNGYAVFERRAEPISGHDPATRR